MEQSEDFFKSFRTLYILSRIVGMNLFSFPKRGRLSKKLCITKIDILIYLIHFCLYGANGLYIYSFYQQLPYLQTISGKLGVISGILFPTILFLYNNFMIYFNLDHLWFIFVKLSDFDNVVIFLCDYSRIFLNDNQWPRSEKF